MKHQLALVCTVLLSSVGAQYFLAPIAVPDSLVEISNADVSTCITRNLVMCQNAFNAALNVTDNLDWTNPQDLSLIINKYYKQGTRGLLAVCSAHQQFYQCLGNQYDVCMQKIRFIRDGESVQNAQQYVGIMKELEFECNGGFLQSAPMWDCIMSVMIITGDDYNKCLQDFNNTIFTDPTKACSAGANMETCVRGPFFACGNDVSWWSCERVRLSTGLDEMCPTNKCQVIIPPPHKSMSLNRRENIQRMLNERDNGQGMVLRELAKKRGAGAN